MTHIDGLYRCFSIIAKHFGEKKGTGIIIHHRFTQLDIATLCGVARETAGIEMAKLEKKKLVKYINHSMLFNNMEKLDSELFLNT